MTTVKKIKWVTNPAGLNFAYSIGDVCELNVKLADELVSNGACEYVEQEDTNADALPEKETAAKGTAQRKKSK